MIRQIFYLIGGFKMTITMHDKFALLPTRCDKCNRLFIFEWYNIYYKQVSPFGELKRVKCKRCLKKDKDNR